MTTLKSLTAAALLSMVSFTPVFAQTFSEPAAFEAQHPDRDVLNGGALTPATRTAQELESLRSRLYNGVSSSKPQSAHRSHWRSRRHR
jgi:hypothetical protein